MNLLRTIDEGQNEWAAWIKAGEPVYYCTSPYNDPDKAKPKACGFSFHGRKQPDGSWTGKKLWFTSDMDKAAKMADYAPDCDWGNELRARKKQLEESLAGSRQSVSYTNFPHPEGLDYFPFQKAGIEYLANRTNTLLADDMGLGKTIQCIGLINVDDSIKNVLVVCPATLKLNWQREMNTWLVRKMKIGIADTKTIPTPEHGFNVVITNYESMAKINPRLVCFQWDLLVIDEAHYLKNQKTLRYVSILGGESKRGVEFQAISARRRVFCTGTPIVNYPAELWPLISAVDPERWNQKTFWYYHKRYCNVSNNGYGMNFRSAAPEERLQELQIKLRETVMIRRLKCEVLTELPPKMRQVVELEWDEDDAAVRQALSAEKDFESVKLDEEKTLELAAQAELAKASDNDDEYRKAIEALSQKNKYLFEEMARVRHDTAVAKLPYVIEYLTEQLEVLPKIIVFYHHHDVGHALANKWPLESVTISGEVEQAKRQMAIDRFQTDENCRIALVSIMAGGVGITLTAASHVYFVELDWVPGNITQAEDRAHRIGQKDVVNAYHLVLRDSIDVNMAKTIISKQKVIESALDKIMENTPEVPVRERAATHGTSRAKIAEEAQKLTAGEIAEIHMALRFLAGDDADFAHARNEVGFNKIDARIGHSLAELPSLTAKQAALAKKIIRKYKRQLGSLWEDIFGEEKDG